MLDHLIRGATVVDGTGAPIRVNDVGVADGRIVAIGVLNDEAAHTVFDAEGLMLTPGFIDIHTHYDAQLHWDPTASPSNIHGVTTVIAGNCGFTLAPVRSEDAEYTLRMLALVEGMPSAALERAVQFRWETFGEFLDVLEDNVSVNAGFYVGHCALRQYVMGDDAFGAATEAQIAKMSEVLHESIIAGGLGLSTTRMPTHLDHLGRRVSSQAATDEEILALCRVVGAHDGTSLALTLAGVLDEQFSESEIDMLVAMSSVSGRPLNWNQLRVDGEGALAKMRPSRQARAAGARVTALTLPIRSPMTQCLGNSQVALKVLPGFREALRLPHDELVALLRDPERRRELFERADAHQGAFRFLLDFATYCVGDTFSATNAPLSGRFVGDIATDRGIDPFNAFVEIALEDDLQTIFWPIPPDDDNVWEQRRVLWDDPDIILGGSDAGAHLDRLCASPYPALFLGDVLRGRQLVPIETAVRLLTWAPARYLGLVGRGRIAVGCHADLVLFNPEAIDSGRPHFVADLPGGEKRIVAEPRGIERVLVNGVVTVVDGVANDQRPGSILRSGRDTASAGLR